MTRLTVAGRLVAAESTEDRRVRGWLVPYGAPGHTNMGRVVVNPGGVTAPDDVSTLFASLDHLDGRDAVASWSLLEDRPEGLWAEWDALPTHGGDKFLAEYHAGKRTGVSMELEPVTIRDGVASGTLIGCAFPERPAFAGARLVAEFAPDTPPDDAGGAAAGVATLAPAVCVHADGSSHVAPTDDAGMASLCADAATAPAPQSPDAAGVEAPTATEQDHDMTETATAPAALLAGAAPSGAAAPAPRAPGAPARLLAADASPRDVFRLLASAHGSPGTRARLLAALSDIVPADTLERDQPQWLGEVWSGNAYTRRVVPLLTPGELTDLKVKGWRWTTKPAMAKYGGNKTAVPSNDPTTEAYEEEAQRFAGGHDIDRKYRDFRDTAFFDSYFSAMSESYARLTDAYAVEEIKANATAGTLGSVPTDVPVGWVAIVDGALQVIDVGTPTFALVEKSVWRSMFLTGTDKFLEFLNASLSFEEGTLNNQNFRIVPVPNTGVGDASSTIGLDVGEVVVGTRAAVKFRELGGGTPIRVDALDLVNGGVDNAVFGYAHLAVEDPRGVVLIDTDADS